jgi:hypothetical protein
MRATILAGAVLLTATAATAATYVPVVPAAGSTTTKIQAINDRGQIAGGYYTADSVEHGFAGTVDGTYQSFDLGTRFTEVHSINNGGMMVGNADDGLNDGYGIAFERSLHTGRTVNIKKGHDLIRDGQTYGISSQGVIVGYGLNPQVFGFYAEKGRYTADLSISQSTSIEPRATNASNVTVGTYLQSTVSGYVSHGFVLQGGVSTQIDYPDAKAVYGTELNAINDMGMATGEWLDAHQRPHAFKYDTTSATFTPLQLPVTGYGKAWGINNHGLIAMTAQDNTSYIYCPNAKRCPSTGTDVADGKPVKALLHR